VVNFSILGSNSARTDISKKKLRGFDWAQPDTFIFRLNDLDIVTLSAVEVLICSDYIYNELHYDIQLKFVTYRNHYLLVPVF